MHAWHIDRDVKSSSSCTSSAMGFNADFFVTDISDRHQCAVCNQVLEDAVVCEKCATHACRSCCERSADKSGGVEEGDAGNGRSDAAEYLPCPSCKAACSASQQLIREVGELVVRCPQSGQGCTSSMALHELRRHVISECGYTLLHCPHDGCPEAALDRNTYERHVAAECEFRVVACAACGARLAQRDLCTHQRERRCFDQLQRRRMVQSQQDTARELRAHRANMLHERHATEQMTRRLVRQHSAKSSADQQKTLRRAHSAPAVRLSLSNGILGAMGSYRLGSAAPHFSRNLQPTTTTTSPRAGRRSSVGAKRSVPCRRCSLQFVPSSNRATSCQFHRGPVAEQFGGTCMNCGKWSTVDGCLSGFHVDKS